MIKNHTGSSRGSLTYNAYNPALEGLRGLAALFVLYGHFFYRDRFLDPGYQPSAGWGHLSATRGAVLLFFVLSGYLIGITNKSSFSQAKAKDYLKRRAVRLYFIYLVALVVTIFAHRGDGWPTVLGNLFFLQNFDAYFGWVLLPLTANPPLWSLNYEVLYYLIFLLVWRFRPNFVFLFLTLAVISALPWLSLGFPDFVAAYSTGFVFWVSGLYLAWQAPSVPTVPRRPHFSNVSLVLFLVALDNFQVLHVVLKAMGFRPDYVSIVDFSQLFSLPLCLMLLANVTGRSLPYLPLMVWLMHGVVGLLIAYLWVSQRLFTEWRWMLGTLFSVCSLLTARMFIWDAWLVRFSQLGKISFAVYVLHHPIIVLVHDYFPYAGNGWSFTARMLVVIGVTLLLSYLLEVLIQPKIKAYLLPVRRVEEMKKAG
ncbi:MAG: acyltransferase [Ferruginibacter sp.]|nr:acyltransferase [Cytophagales bacterium]